MKAPGPSVVPPTDDALPAPEPPAPTQTPLREITQADIDAALQEWNGDMDSKRRVQQYMTDHSREKGAAERLRNEYGDGLPAFPVTAEGAATDLPWPKVQRHLAGLVKEDRFLSGEERGEAAVEEPKKDAPAQPTVREIFDQYKPVVAGLVLADVAYQNACRNSDKETAIIEGDAAVKRAALTITEPDFMRLYYDMPDFRYRLHREVIDETYAALSQPQQELEPELAEAAVVVRDPLAPAYNVGDTVYLDNTAFEITDINLFEVQLRDPAQTYPILRSEPKERFETLLQRDSRNSHITDFLAADLGQFNEDFREILTSGLLTDEDRSEIIEYFRAGKGNREMGGLLSGLLGNRVDTVELATGETADYFTSGLSMRIEILNDDEVKIASAAYSWHQIAPVLRSLWQQELDGFTRVPVQREPVWLEGTPSYQVGDKVSFQYGDREISGTIGYIGDLDVRIDTGPYAWSNQTVSRDFFDDAIRQDQRNAHLFTQKPELTPAPEATPGTATIYPGDKNGLPFDIIVQRLPVDEPEQAQPEQTDAPQNFHITDDHLGEGGPKAKFRMNAEAITTLHEIEFDGRTATPEEQEILSRYVGWGALADAFDPNKPDWADEYKELQVLLTPEEYKAARASVLNAHYTSPTVIKAIYEAVGNMGFTSGNILEPSCGVGNFFGLLPEAMAASKLYGVELDSITGRIAQQLYPRADITVAGFETTDRRDFYDLAVGNGRGTLGQTA